MQTVMFILPLHALLYPFFPGKDALLYQLHVLMEKPILPKKKKKSEGNEVADSM